MLAASVLGACGGSTATREEPGARASQGASTSNSSGGSASGASASTSATTPAAAQGADTGARNGFDVSGQADGGAGFDVSGTSDLPNAVPSTAQPYARMVESAVARLRPALAECLRPLGPGRRVLRAVVALDGALTPRPPQAYEMPPRVASCVEGVLRAATLDPPPPREFPYDIYLTIDAR